MSSDLLADPAAVPAPADTPPKPVGWPWPPPPTISSAQALAIATADAETAYRGNFGRFRIEIVLEDDGWHVTHEIHQRHGSRVAGGGPHYIIDAHTGAILSKKYYQ